MNEIRKIGAVILDGRKVLVGRDKDKDKFVIPGGRIEKGETDINCLKRELNEEYGVGLVSATYLGTYRDEAALDPGMMITMKVYRVEINGKPRARSEVEESAYVNSKTKRVKLGSIIEKFVIPELARQGLID